ncbi:PAS domain-containing sensor histidine kinase [Aquimarina sp. MMG016]|uniref:sensor histidine kinase n=1 Tax=Aquimarina sp. MMG016 TaxID=2822690 RepID=UPI001B3A4C4D|nr:PAS domain-containing sensor histidine kinase [Aquimarina sp. MMG016]MBQ4820298.1 PAS domain S-box protein [Aquimarina sp. MMG016]
MSTSNNTPKHNELTFQLMVDASPNALILVNEQGKIVYTNSFVEKLFQYERSEIIGQKIEILIPARFKGYHPGYMHSFFKNPQARMMGIGRDLFAIRKDKTEFPVEIGLNPIITVDGNLVLASVIDISERKKAEERFRLVVESAPSAMILVDKKGVIKLVNTQTEKLFRYHRDELLGQKIEILLPSEVRDNHPKYRKEFSKNPEIRSMGAGRDLYAIDRDKNRFPVEIGLNPIETNDGKMVLASVIDITSRKKAEEASAKYTKKLENKNKELEQFTFIASHDLQEPLKSITGLTEILTEEYSNILDDEGRESFAFLNESTERMKQLITALLDYSRLGQKSEIEDINCNDILDNVIKDLASSISEANVKFEIDSLPLIKGYKTELRLLFQNLISNAIKFRKIDSPTLIKISSENQKKMWQFKIQDNGIGIDMKFTNKIFTIFQQLNSKEEYPGSGIGLSHCKKIIDLHDGDIWVESEPGKGSIFYFTINSNLQKS